MATPKIQSVAGLKQYILRKLGYPAHNIEITDEQLQDCIDDTLDDYLPVAYSGVNERYIPIKLIAGVNNYVLPYNTFAVVSVNDANMSMIGSNMPSNMFSINQFIAADLYRPGVAKIDIMGYEMINQMTSTLDLIFAKKITFDFNSISKILHLHGNVAVDQTVIIQVYQKLDLDSTPISAGASRYEEENIYNEKIIKRLATARAMKQWGTNIGLKYSGSVLPNGGTINYEGISAQAEKEIEACLLEIEDQFRLPIDFMVG